MIVYLIHNIVNGKYYVGWTSLSFRQRWKIHCDSAKKETWHFSRAIKKYGADSFFYEILSVVESEQQAKQLEQLWILTLRSYDPQVGYNMTYGGESGLPNEEKRKNLSNSNKYKGKPGGFRKGIKQSKESIERTVQGIKDYWKQKSKEEASQHMKHAASFRIYDNNFSETCRRIRTGRTAPEATKKKLSELLRVRHSLLTSEQRSAKSPTRGRMFITNGIENKVVDLSSEIPEGWRRGKVRVNA